MSRALIVSVNIESDADEIVGRQFNRVFQIIGTSARSHALLRRFKILLKASDIFHSDIPQSLIQLEKARVLTDGLRVARLDRVTQSSIRLDNLSAHKTKDAKRFLRAYSKSAKPFRWTYTDPKRRIAAKQIAVTPY